MHNGNLFLLRNIVLSTKSHDRRVCNLLTSNPAEEKMRSEGTDVAGIAKSVLAIWAIQGYFDSHSFHQVSVLSKELFEESLQHELC